MQVIALADNAAANNGLQEALSSAREQAADFQKQSAEADSSKRALEQELGRLRKQLADEQAERATLDEQLAQHLEDTGDYTAQVNIILGLRLVIMTTMLAVTNAHMQMLASAHSHS